MKIHFNSIEHKSGIYTYSYHAQIVKRSNSTFAYFAIAGVVGSFKVVSESGWLYLIPFWIAIFLLSKFMNWLIKKMSHRKTALVRFQSKYPHYNLGDILWMLKCTNQETRLNELVNSASDDWGSEFDIEIGKLTAIEIRDANFSNEILNEALHQQTVLKNQWSKITGKEYPDLGMPKR